MATTAKTNVRLTGIMLAISIALQTNCWALAATSDVVQIDEATNADSSPEQALEVAPSLALSAAGMPSVDSSALQSLPSTVIDASPALLAAAGLPQLGALPDNQDSLQGRIDSVDPNSAIDRVDDLTKQILFKEIELERFNLHYKQNVGKQGRWKGLRYAILQEGNFGCNLAGSINNMGERYQHIHDPGKNSTARLEMGNAISMIGSIIGASAAAFELCVNEYHCLEAGHKGFSTKAARAHVLDLKAQINKLMVERDALVQIEQSAPLLRAHAEIDLVEGRVLKDMRDLGFLEYTRFHIGQQRFIAYQQSLYFFDLCKYTTASIGSAFAFLALHKHRRIWNNRAGVLFDIQGALTVAAPFASRGFGLAYARLQKHIVAPVSRDVQTREIAQLEKDQSTLDQLCKEGKCPPDSVRAPVDRAAVYTLGDQGFQDELHSSLQANRKAKLVATQNIASSVFVGGTKIASGVLFNVVGKDFNTKSERSTLVTNSNLYAAAVLGTVGSSVAVLDTVRLQALGELNRHKLSKQGKLPSQLINTRLKQLDEMETKLKVSGKGAG